MNHPYRQYQKTSITTASREKVLLMLYEGAIRFVKSARVHMEKKNVAEKGTYISKATAIVSELMSTLDFKAGGELAHDLESLYIYMIDKLIEANIDNDLEALDHVEELLRTLHVAWRDVIENPRKDGVPSARLQPDLYKDFVAEKGSPTAPGRSAEREQGHSSSSATSSSSGQKFSGSA